ncbi:MAG: hypothetical protein ACREQQ_09605 [Candidatus Binatia bacterium]
MKTTAVTLVAALVLLGAAGCEQQEGPAERAGEQMDKAAEHTGEAMKEMGKKMEEESKP